MHMREMKERERRKAVEEEMRLKKKAAEDALEAARLAQVQEQMANKAYTYDSSGNIIWVQPIQVDKLPSYSTAMSFACKKERGAESPRPIEETVRSSSKDRADRSQRNKEK